MRRILSMILICVLVVTMLPLQVAADANTPYTHPNTYSNTGNQRADIIGVALTQVGYLEGAGNNTKYGEALGINYLGWCGAFVSWCAIEAGIPNSVLVKTGRAEPGSFGLSVKPTGYIPQSGDLFFSKTYSHVGLVYYLDGDYFVSIEGNTYTSGDEGVYIRRHKISDVVFASPNYQGSGNHNYVSGSEDAHPHKVFYRCSDCGSQYYTGATTTRNDCNECKQATCSHSYGSWTTAGTSNHSHTCSKCGKVEEKAHNWNSGVITTPATCKQDGVKTQICNTCGAEKRTTIASGTSHAYSAWTKRDDNYHIRACSECDTTESKTHTWNTGTITTAATCLETGIRTQRCTGCGAERTQTVPVSTTHSYTPWEVKDDGKHTHTCTVCGKEETKAHNMAMGWQTSQTSHWYACTDCHHQFKLEKHVFGESCDSPCTICGYASESGHHFTDQWSTDDNSHWFACESCDIQGSLENHVFDAACDDSCNTCGFTQQTQHAFGDTYVTDGMNHWDECANCGKQDQLSSHISSEAAYEGAATYCTVCQLQLTEERDHEHFFHESYSDDMNHWGVCACGFVMETEPHTWSIRNGACSACGSLLPQQEVADDDLTPWILGGAGMLVLLTVLVTLVIVISKKSGKKQNN